MRSLAYMYSSNGRLLALAGAILQSVTTPAGAVPAWTPAAPVPCNPHASPPEVCPVSGVVCPPSGLCPNTAGNASDPALVHTTGGPLRGIAGQKYRMWLGVPFAEPPVDELRWMPDTLEAFDKRSKTVRRAPFTAAGSPAVQTTRTAPWRTACTW